MYVDFHKYNYDLVPVEQRAEYLKRDQESYKIALRKWFESNLESIVERKWAIKDIHYLKEISDFIKLIREGEQLYELGFFTGCIALIGVASEDFMKYLSIKLSKPQYERLTQFDRINKLKDDGLISISTHDLIDKIRIIRNDCLHYNQDFKQKSTSELQTDALTALNTLKEVVKTLIGDTFVLSGPELTTILSSISADADTRNTDELTIKVKNAVSHLLKLPIAFSPNTKFQVRTSIFTIIDIDYESVEFSLKDISNGMFVIVEYPEAQRSYYQNKNLSNGDLVSATLISVIDQNGLTVEWNILDLNKENRG